MMRNNIIILLIISIIFGACSEKENDNLVMIKGGNFINQKSNFYEKNIKISDFYIGKYEVNQKEWADVMGANPSKFQFDVFPVESVTWYDCVEYCNKRSEKEGFKPYYNIDKIKKDSSNTNELDDVKWTVSVNPTANGYRLPTEEEWEYVASGGQMSKNFKYAGSDKIEDVGYYWINSGDNVLSGNWNWGTLERNHCKPKDIGTKKPNELGIYDMSGNVREWCWDIHQSINSEDFQGRTWKGGGWIGGDFCCATSFRGSYAANGKAPDQGFRVCRNI